MDSFADVMRCAEEIVSGPVTVVAKSIGVFPLQCSGSFLEIHFVTAFPEEQQPGKQVNFLRFCRSVAGGDTLLSECKGFLVNQRFVSIGEEITLVLRIFSHLFGLVRNLAGFRRDSMA